MEGEGRERGCPHTTLTSFLSFGPQWPQALPGGP